MTKNLKFVSVLLTWIFAFSQISWADIQHQSLAPSSIFTSDSEDNSPPEEKILCRLFNDTSQMGFLRQRLSDRGYVYPGDEIAAYNQGTFSGPIDFLLRYPKDGPPVLGMQTPGMRSPRGAPEVEIRTKKAVG